MSKSISGRNLILTASLMGTLVAAVWAPPAVQAEDGVCNITAVAFDADLNRLAEERSAAVMISTAKLARDCANNFAAAVTPAADACRANVGAQFVALFRRLDGVDLIGSKDSRAKFKSAEPDKDKASIKLRSCAFWLAQ